MTLDTSFVDSNRESSRRMRAIAENLSEEQLRKPVGKSWTVSITLAHVAFWDMRVLHVLDMTERNNKLCAPQIDIVANDIMLPLLAAIPPREAVRIAIETSELLDRRLENYPLHLLEEIFACYERWVVRSLHRNAHLDAIEKALQH